MCTSVCGTLSVYTFSYRLGESQTDQRSVEEACAQNVEGVEADRVPHANMRSQMLPRERKYLTFYTQ